MGAFFRHPLTRRTGKVGLIDSVTAPSGIRQALNITCPLATQRSHDQHARLRRGPPLFLRVTTTASVIRHAPRYQNEKVPPNENDLN